MGVYTSNYHPSGSGAGRVSCITSTVPLTSDLAFGYDGSLLRQTSWTGLAPGTVTVDRTYNDDFRLEESSVNGTSTVSFLYDNDGLVTNAGEAELVRSGPQGLVETITVGSVKETRAYNTFGEIESITAVLKTPGQPDQPLLELTYPMRDTLGRIIEQTETIGTAATTTIEYGYHPSGWLRDVTRNGVPVAPSPAYTYDPNGNRLSSPGPIATPDYDSQDRMRRYGDASYDYTPNGELLRKTVGSMVTEYVYDVFGNLRSATLPDGTLIEYVIDTVHRRVGKRVDNVLVQAWLYDGQLRPIAELDATGAVVSRFVYASRDNVPDYVVLAGTTYRILADHLGSVRLVVDVSTGVTAQQISYDEFGVATLIEGSWDVQPFGFAGGLYDHDTGLVRFGARDYDPTVGRWRAKDPLGFASGATNVYGRLERSNQSDRSVWSLWHHELQLLPPSGCGKWRRVRVSCWDYNMLTLSRRTNSPTASANACRSDTVIACQNQTHAIRTTILLRKGMSLTMRHVSRAAWRTLRIHMMPTDHRCQTRILLSIEHGSHEA